MPLCPEPQIQCLVVDHCVLSKCLSVRMYACRYAHCLSNLVEGENNDDASGGRPRGWYQYSQYSEIFSSALTLRTGI